MAEKKDLNKQVPSNVIPLGPTKCKAEDCKHKPQRADFCNEHFEWFKAGLITKDGHKSPDFDKKYQHYAASKRKAA